MPRPAAPTGGYTTETIRLDDGRRFTLRPLRRNDVAALQRAFRRLSPEEIRLRFLQYTHELPGSVVAQILELDPAEMVGFVIDDGEEIRAVADLHVYAGDPETAEFGLIVGKAVSGHGLGKLLLQRIFREADRLGIRSVHGDVRADNERMLELCRDLGADIRPMTNDPTMVSVRFTPLPAPG